MLCMREYARETSGHIMQVVVGVRGKPLGASPLLVLPVGDALQEPFWPEGLGINRGMHNAFDACFCANHINEFAVVTRSRVSH